MAGAGESSDLSVLSARVHRALAADQEVLVELRRFDDEYADLERVVRDLPAKTSHEVMVPFTDVAFYPGRLVHTNELLVLLGAEVYAEGSATRTLVGLHSRMSFSPRPTSLAVRGRLRTTTWRAGRRCWI